MAKQGLQLNSEISNSPVIASCHFPVSRICAWSQFMCEFCCGTRWNHHGSIIDCGEGCDSTDKFCWIFLERVTCFPHWRLHMSPKLFLGWWVNSSHVAFHKRWWQRFNHGRSKTSWRHPCLQSWTNVACSKTTSHGLMEDRNSPAVCSIVNEHASVPCIKVCGAKRMKDLCTHATQVNKSAFLGWVIGADFFSCCKETFFALQKSKPIGKHPWSQETCCSIWLWQNTGVEWRNNTGKMAVHCKALSNENSSKMCNPKKWNHSGHKVVSI